MAVRAGLLDHPRVSTLGEILRRLLVGRASGKQATQCQSLNGRIEPADGKPKNAADAVSDWCWTLVGGLEPCP